jgi:hypothetical protein
LPTSESCPVVVDSCAPDQGGTRLSGDRAGHICATTHR